MPSHYLNQCWLILNYTLENIFRLHLSQNTWLFSEIWKRRLQEVGNFVSVSMCWKTYICMGPIIGELILLCIKAFRWMRSGQRITHNPRTYARLGYGSPQCVGLQTHGIHQYKHSDSLIGQNLLVYFFYISCSGYSWCFSVRYYLPRFESSGCLITFRGLPKLFVHIWHLILAFNTSHPVI